MDKYNSKYLATGNIATSEAIARTAANRVCNRSSNRYPNLITSYFKPNNSTGRGNKKTVINCVSDICSSNQVSCSNNNYNLDIGPYNSHYTSMDSFKYNQCKDNRCKLCPNANMKQIDNSRNLKKFCKVYNCIYLIECKICGLKYIGQTGNTLNKRINLHRSQVYNAKRKSLVDVSIEINHFVEHGVENMMLTIIDLIIKEKLRLWWENYHIQMFNSVYPYGLNTLLFGKNIGPSYISNMSIPRVNPYYSMPMNNMLKRKQRGSGGGTRNYNVLLEKLNTLCLKIEKLSYIPYNWIKNFVYGVKRKWIGNIWKLCNSSNFLDKFGSDSLIPYAFIDCIKARSSFLGLNLSDIVSNNKLNKAYCTVTYSNSLEDKIPFSKILNSCSSLIPIKNLYIIPCFKYSLPIGRKIFNYNEISKNIHKHMPATCECYTSSPYHNTTFNHVITGNLEIIKDYELKLIMYKGTGYRLTGSKFGVVNSFNNDLDNFVYKLAVKYSHPTSTFAEWVFNIKQLFQLSFDNQLLKYNCSDPNVSFKSLKNSIDKLRNSYVITYVDKMANNYAIICKRFYCDKLIDIYRDTAVYKHIDINLEVIKNKINALYLRIGFNIGINKIKFPYIVLIPKFHKVPIKFRAVTIGCNTYLTIANTRLLELLKIVMLKIKKEGSYIVNNSYEVVKSISYMEDIVGVSSYDFSDLFNSINLDDLHSIILNLYERYDLPEFITYNRYKSLLQLVLKETYLYNGREIYKQIHGIPMGGGCSSILADIYLHNYETGTSLLNEVKFFRYVDDILVCYVRNTGLDFSFYPSNLNLVETTCNKEGYLNFLDLSIKINNGSVTTKMYDKRDDYSFRPNRIMSWSTCLHINIKRNIITNFLIRCKRLNTELNDMDFKIKQFINFALEMGFPKSFLMYNIKIFLNISKIEYKQRFL
jgi:hypothetical protein